MPPDRRTGDRPPPVATRRPLNICIYLLTPASHPPTATVPSSAILTATVPSSADTPDAPPIPFTAPTAPCPQTFIRIRAGLGADLAPKLKKKLPASTLKKLSPLKLISNPIFLRLRPLRLPSVNSQPQRRFFFVPELLYKKRQTYNCTIRNTPHILYTQRGTNGN